MNFLSQWLKKNKELINIIFFNLIFLAIFVELGSLAFYFVKHKQLFYTRNDTQQKEAIAEAGFSLDEARIDEGILERLHPFFGYVMKPGIPFYLEFSSKEFKVNNYGFPSAYDYPVVRQNSQQFIIGVVGGSVASNFGLYELENKILAETLKRQVPELADKEIIVLPLAVGGYKQPQQVLILNYFLAIGQEFDLVINIDGFNEVALSNLNRQENIDISMPSVQQFLPLRDLASNNLSPEEIQRVAELLNNKEELQKGLERLEKSKLASIYLYRTLKVQNLVKTYQENTLAFEKLRSQKQGNESEADLLVNVKKADASASDSQGFEGMVELWANSSKLMRDTLADRNAMYFHFIQPNQYYPTGREFSEAERKIAIVEDHPYQSGVVEGYPQLLATVQKLKGEGVNIFSAVNIFDEVKETVYIDTCCHYNAEGNRIFSNYIAEAIAKTLNQDANFKSRFASTGGTR